MLIMRLLLINWIKNILYFDIIEYQNSLYRQFLCRMNFNFVICQCKINWFTWLHNSCTWCLFRKDSISQDCKLYLRTKHVTPNCLSLSSAISAIISTVLCKQVTLHSTMLFEGQTWHTEFCYFNILLHLTSCILTECENTTVTDNGAISAVTSVTARSSLILVHFVDGGQFHVLAALSAGPLKRRLCELLFRSARLFQEKSPLSVLDI
jgi:hypothetical protein